MDIHYCESCARINNGFSFILATKFPLHQMPTLEVDGRVICQTSAIVRYLATEFNLYGANNEERVIIDQVAETLRDVFTEVAGIIFGKETEEKKVTLLFTTTIWALILLYKYFHLRQSIHRSRNDVTARYFLFDI